MYTLTCIHYANLLTEQRTQVTMQIKKTENNMTKLVDTVEFFIPKVYRDTNSGFDWECRRFLNQNGYPDITYDETPPTSFIPDADPITPSNPE